MRALRLRFIGESFSLVCLRKTYPQEGKELRICYCEDEAAQAEFLKKKVELWAGTKQIKASVDLYSSAEEYLFKTEKFDYDVIFIDISMKNMNGMELAKQIRADDKDVILVFVTSDPSFVFEGYEVDAYRYLMKPINDSKLFEILEYAGTRNLADHSCIVVRTDSRNQRIRLCDLLYIEVQGHYVDMHLADGRVVKVKSSFSDILSQVNAADGHLIQTHRSYAVNLSHVVRIGRTECCMDAGERIPVSKSAYRELNEAFIRYSLAGR